MDFRLKKKKGTLEWENWQAHSMESVFFCPLPSSKHVSAGERWGGRGESMNNFPGNFPAGVGGGGGGAGGGSRRRGRFAFSLKNPEKGTAWLERMKRNGNANESECETNKFYYGTIYLSPEGDEKKSGNQWSVKDTSLQGELSRGGGWVGEREGWKGPARGEEPEPRNEPISITQVIIAGEAPASFIPH